MLRPPGVAYEPNSRCRTIQMPITVSIVDDNPQLRKSLSQLLNMTERLECIGMYANVDEAIRGVDANTPDVLLMDIEMPGRSGIEGTRVIKQRHSSVNVIMLTAFAGNERILESIIAGATGYLLKKTEPEKLIAAIIDIHNGGSVMTASVARTVLDLVRQPRAQSAESREDFFTDRERSVLELLMAGKSYHRIGEELFISVDTVRSHIRHIYEKLQVHTKSAAVAEAMRRGLV